MSSAGGIGFEMAFELWRSPKLTHLCSQKSDPLPAHLFVLWRPDAQTFQ